MSKSESVMSKKINNSRLIQYALVAKLSKQRMDQVYEELYKRSYGFGWTSSARIPTFRREVDFNITAKGYMLQEDLDELTKDKVVYGEIKEEDWGLRDCQVMTKEMEEEGVLEYYESINDLL